MADTTRLVIELETILRGLNKTLRGLDQIKKRLDGLTTAPRGRTDAIGKSIQRQLQTQQRAVEALQRQRSAALIAEEKKRLSAIEALQRQRSAALLQQERQRQRQQAALERRNAAAAESLQRQRSRAILAQIRAQEQALERARRSALTLDQVLGRVGGSLRNLGQGIASLGASLSVALTAPLTALGVLATRNAVTLDSLNRGLVAISGSADEASVQLRRLTGIAKLPGIGFQEAIQGSIRLQAVGFSAEEAEKALIQFSNAVALTGGGRDELNRITVQLGQLASKGKVLAQDLKPIIEAAPAVGVALRQAFGTVNSEDIQALGISTDEFLDKLVKQLGQLPRAAAGARNTFDNFTDSLFRATAALGEGIIPVLTRLIQTFEPVIIGLANGFKQLSPSVQTVIVVFGALTAAIGPLLFVFGQFVAGIGGLISFFGRLFTVMQAAIPAINGVTAP